MRKRSKFQDESIPSILELNVENFVTIIIFLGKKKEMGENGKRMEDRPDNLATAIISVALQMAASAGHQAHQVLQLLRKQIPRNFPGANKRHKKFKREIPRKEETHEAKLLDENKWRMESLDLMKE